MENKSGRGFTINFKINLVNSVVSRNNFLYIGENHLDSQDSHKSMSKLTQKKIEWIIKQKQNRVGTSEIARIMKVTSRYVNRIYQKYREEGKVEIKRPGRKKDPIAEEIKQIIYRVKEEHPQYP